MEGVQGLGPGGADDLEPVGALLQVVGDAAVVAPAESDAGLPGGVAVAAADDRFPVQVDGVEGTGGGFEVGEDGCRGAAQRAGFAPAGEGFEGCGMGGFGLGELELADGGGL